MDGKLKRTMFSKLLRSSLHADQSRYVCHLQVTLDKDSGFNQHVPMLALPMSTHFAV